MKRFPSKILALILALMLLWTGTAFAGIDFSAMTDDELRELIDGAGLELTGRRALASGGTALYKGEEFELYLTGEYEFDGEDMFRPLQLGVQAVNKTGRDVSMDVERVVVNGLSVDGFGVYEIPVGSSRKDMIEFWLENTDITAYDHIRNVRFVINLYDDETYDTILTSEPIELWFDADGIHFGQKEENDGTAGGVQRFESVTGLFSMEVPESYIVIDAELAAMLMQLSKDAATENYAADEQMTGLLEAYDAISMVDLQNMDYVLADDMSANLNTNVTHGTGISPVIFRLAYRQLYDALKNYYTAMGISEDSISLLGLENYGGYAYMGMRVENVLGMVVYQYATVNEEQTMLIFTFTNIPEEIIGQVMNSIIVY